MNPVRELGTSPPGASGCVMLEANGLEMPIQMSLHGTLSNPLSSPPEFRKASLRRPPTDAGVLWRGELSCERPQAGLSRCSNPQGIPPEFKASLRRPPAETGVL